MAAITTNYYDKIFRKWKSIFEADERTAMVNIHGFDNSKKPNMPALVIFPVTKRYESDGMRESRRIATPRKAIYIFNLYAYIQAPIMHDAYYSTDYHNIGLTQLAIELEEVIKDNATATDPDDSTVKLWYDVNVNEWSFDQDPGKLLIVTTTLEVRRTETVA